MQRLADVELQLVMQGLTAQEILKLARCSRFLLHAADAPFAWHYARLCLDAKPTFPLPKISLPKRIIGWCKKTLVTQKPPLDAPRLSRHAKVMIKWQRQLGSRLGVLAISSRVAAVYELDALWCYYGYDPTDMSLLLRLSSMQQLRVLSVYYDTEICPDVMKTIVELPYLHTLSLPEASSRPDYSGIDLLSQAPELTSLHFQDTFFNENSSQLIDHVAACSKLRDLSVVRPCLYGRAWPIFFAHPHIHQLHSLKLHGFCARGQLKFIADEVTQHEFQIAFAGMHHLHTLHLSNCRHIDLMLPALAHAPALHHLTITPELNFWIPVRETETAPSALVLKTLLAAAPQLHCVLVLVQGMPLRIRFESDAVLSAAARFMIREWIP